MPFRPGYKKFIEDNFDITNKKNELVPFKLNKIQDAFISRDADPHRNCILKARQQGFCLDSDTPILLANLTWKKIKNISVGEELVAVDEKDPDGRGNIRKLQTTTVEAIRLTNQEAFKITMESGRELIATAEHRFLATTPSRIRGTWRKVKKLKIGGYIRYITETWDEQNIEDSWVGGIIDGEAHFRRKKPVGGITFNRINEVFKIIGITRLIRHVGKKWWEGKGLPGKRSGEAWDKIISIEPVGKRTMIDLQTGCKTFIANGYISHNSSLILGIFTTDFLLKDFSHSVIVADNRENAEGLLERVKLYIESYESRKGFKINLKYNTKNELYNKDTRSKYTIGTAQNVQFGRSKTITNLHLCVGENTKIISTNGIAKRIKDIVVGDEVISESGLKTVVTNKWDTGKKPIKKIRLWLSNETIDVSPDHKIRVASTGYNNKLSDLVWKKAKDLTTDDFVMWAYPKTGAYVKHLVVKNQKGCTHLEDKKKCKEKLDNLSSSGLVLKTDYKLGYFIGYYLAEGNITKNLNRISFTCHQNEEFYKNFIDLFPILPEIKIRSDKTGVRKIITYNSREISMFVNNLVGRVEQKHIPDKFLYEYPKEFLQGMYDAWKDGDGSKFDYKSVGKQKLVSITTIRESIGRQMRQIYCLLNHKVPALDLRENRSRYGKKTQDVFILREHGSSELKKNGTKSHKGMKYRYLTTRKMTAGNGCLFVQVKSIDDIEEQQTYEIEVADKSHSFLTVCGVISNSEAAFFPNMQKLLSSALQAVTEDGQAIIETTANGYSYFRDFWIDCLDGKRNFKPSFYGASQFYDKEFLNKRKAELGREYQQEFPETWMEAFLASGDTYFDKESLEYYLQNSVDPIHEFEYGMYNFEGSK